MVEGALGRNNRRGFFPLIGALFLFILFGNLIGLIPGFISPDGTLQTNAIGLALMVFALTHFYGFKEHRGSAISSTSSARRSGWRR